MLHTTNTAAIIPLRLPFEDIQYSNEAFSTLSEYLESHGITINDRSILVQADVYKTNECKSYFIYSYMMKDWIYAVQYLTLKFDYNLPNDLSDEELEQFKWNICYDFSNSISKLFLYLHIAYPGSVSYFGGVVLCDDRRISDIPNMDFSIGDCVISSIEKKYPKIQQLTFFKVRSWLDENEIDIYGRPNSKIAKAINCLTHICHSENNTCQKLVFSLMALEILYTKGNTNLTEQLNEKIQVFLGPLLESKKLIKNMYSIRSRFLHGDLPLLSFTMYGNTAAQYEDEISEAFNLSLSILIATIQKMIETDKTELNFEVKLVD